MASAVSNAVVLLSRFRKAFPLRPTARRFWLRWTAWCFFAGATKECVERVAEHMASEEALHRRFLCCPGGELGAALIVDAVTRLIPGALGNEDIHGARVVFSPWSPQMRLRLTLPLPRIAERTREHSRAKLPQCARSAPEIGRTTRALRNFAAGKCLRFYWAATTKRFAAGASAWRWKRRGAIAPDLLPRSA